MIIYWVVRNRGSSGRRRVLCRTLGVLSGFCPSEILHQGSGTDSGEESYEVLGTEFGNESDDESSRESGKSLVRL